MRPMQSVLASILLMLPVNAFAQNRPTALLAPTKPSQVVTLSTFFATPCPAGNGLAADVQTLPDGTLAPFPGIPAGQVLVLTGLSFVITGPGTTEPRQVLVIGHKAAIRPVRHRLPTPRSILRGSQQRRWCGCAS